MVLSIAPSAKVALGLLPNKSRKFSNVGLPVISTLPSAILPLSFIASAKFILLSVNRTVVSNPRTTPVPTSKSASAALIGPEMVTSFNPDTDI